jgi:hypothetical protein
MFVQDLGSATDDLVSVRVFSKKAECHNRSSTREALYQAHDPRTGEIRQ